MRTAALGQYIGWALAVLLSGFAGFIGGYLKKKGENLAMREELNQIIAQVTATTEATQRIETRFSYEMWDRQKRWELKREVLFEVTKQMGAIKGALIQLHAFYQTEKQTAGQDYPERVETRIKRGDEWLQASAQFDNTSVFVGILCGVEALNVVTQFSVFARDVGMKLTNGNPDAYQESVKVFVDKMNTVTEIVRKELAVAK